MLISDQLIDSARQRHDRRRGLWLLIAAGTLWGTGGFIGSLLAGETGLAAPAVAAYRLGLGGLMILLYVVITRRGQQGRLPRGRRAWTRVLLLGALAAEFQATYFAAVSHAGVSLATLITIGAAPVLVLVAEAVTGRRRIGPVALLTAVLAVAGLVLLVGAPSGERSPADVLAGAGFALLAAAGFATMTLIGARPVAGLDHLVSTGAGFTFGSLLLVPLAGSGLTFTPDPAALGLLLLFGLAPTAIAYAAYFRGLADTAAGTGALMALLEPLVGTVLAVLVLGERLGPAGVAGAALLVTALVLEARSTART